MDDFGGPQSPIRPHHGLQHPGSRNTDSDPQADQLINASVSSSDPNAGTTAYLTAQQPGLHPKDQALSPVDSAT